MYPCIFAVRGEEIEKDTSKWYVCRLPVSFLFDPAKSVFRAGQTEEIRKE